LTALGPLVLPSDVLVAPVAQLPVEQRTKIEAEQGDYCVTRPRTRITTSIIDVGTALLLERFRQPSTIVDAVISFSEAAGLEPEQVLDQAFPVLARFVRDGLLLPADSALVQAVESSLAVGEVVGGTEIVEAVQVLVDSDVYRARLPDGSSGALKLARQGAPSRVAALVRHEAAVLRELDGQVNPRLLASGEHAGCAFLLTSWVAGVDVHDAAAEAHRLGGPQGVAGVLDLSERVVAAYAHLHAQDVLHGDVHPRNVLVGPDERVVLLDFGFAVGGGAGHAVGPPVRGGVDFFLEPESAGALLAGRTSEQTPLGEQYSVAALVYLVLTGAHTHSFSLEREQMLRQLRDEPPLPFSTHRGPSLPATERVLRRALSRNPADRHLSLAHMLKSLRTAAASDRAAAERATSDASPTRTPEAGTRLLDGVLARLAAPGPLFDGGLAAPTASAWSGGAGFAYALLRIARVRDDGDLLAVADLWSVQATRASARDEAFVDEDAKVVPEIFGQNSLYHHLGGVQCVQALIAQARGDARSRDVALDAFLHTAGAPCLELDVGFGRCGLLLGCAILLEACVGSARETALRALGTELRDSVWSELAGRAGIADGHPLQLLGAAHGWAGYLFAVLRWAQATATPLPDGVADRLDQLGAFAYPAGRGLLWPFEANGQQPDPVMGASWCNGAAGHVPLWWLAHTLTAEPRYEQWARGAAWAAFEGPLDALGDLCCGLTGRAYALLSHYAHVDEPVWLARARMLAEHAAESSHTCLRRDSLYKGEVGTALLIDELSAPELARMPLYDGEGWPAHPRLTSKLA
jgi:serine/threonine-protein kinase